MTKMSTHEKKPRPPRLPSSNNPSSSSSHTNNNHKPPSSTSASIATPPRAALRFKPSTSADPQDSSSAASIKSTETTDAEDAQSLIDTSLALLLAEKDGRIAELEAEMRTMEAEFERELTQLSLKLTSESETALFWQQKHASLHATFLKTETELRVLRQEFASSAASVANSNSNSNMGSHSGAGAAAQEKAREERERDIKTRITSLVLDRDAFREAYNEAMGEMRVKDEMVRELRGQVRGLKAWVSVSGKTTEQVADEAFGEKWRRLGNGLQNWVITGFRRVKIDLEKADEKTKEELSQLVPNYETLASSSKIHLIQSLLSQLLVNHIFNAYFVGLSPEHADELRKTEQLLGTFGSVESINAWRSTTLSILHKDPTKLLPQTTHLTTTLLTTLTTLTTAITSHSSPGATPPSPDTSTLRPLLTSAIELSRLLRVQKAIFQIEMPIILPYQRIMFDRKEMEDIGGEEEEDLVAAEREVICVTFPGMVKSGDENGERGHLRNVVARVKVVCAPD